MTRELTFDEWDNLPLESKRDICNHYWDPYEPTIGIKTKQKIVEQLSDTLKGHFEQIGISSFGWGVYMLFVVVKNSKQRIPKHFSELPVNKGVILKHLENNKVRVKFNYGGITEFDLTNKIIIK